MYYNARLQIPHNHNQVVRCRAFSTSKLSTTECFSNPFLFVYGHMKIRNAHQQLTFYYFEVAPAQCVGNHEQSPPLGKCRPSITSFVGLQLRASAARIIPCKKQGWRAWHAKTLISYVPLLRSKRDLAASISTAHPLPIGMRLLCLHQRIPGDWVDDFQENKVNLVLHCLQKNFML